MNRLNIMKESNIAIQRLITEVHIAITKNSYNLTFLALHFSVLVIKPFALCLAETPPNMN